MIVVLVFLFFLFFFVQLWYLPLLTIEPKSQPHHFFSSFFTLAILAYLWCFFFFFTTPFVIDLTIAETGLCDGDTVFLVQTPLLCVWMLNQKQTQKGSSVWVGWISAINMLTPVGSEQTFEDHWIINHLWMDQWEVIRGESLGDCITSPGRCIIKMNQRRKSGQTRLELL